MIKRGPLKSFGGCKRSKQTCECIYDGEKGRECSSTFDPYPQSGCVYKESIPRAQSNSTFCLFLFPSLFTAPTMTPTSVSESSSLESIDAATIMAKRHESMLPPEKEERLFRSPKEMINDLLQQVEQTELRHAMRVEIKRLLTDHERLVSMLQQRSELLEHENDELRHASQEHQRRYEKAVREMQFFKRKYEHHRQQEEEQRPKRSLSIDSRTSSEQQQQQPPHAGVAVFPLTPTSPQPIPEEPKEPSSSTIPAPPTTKPTSITDCFSPPYDGAELTRMAKSPIPLPASFVSRMKAPPRNAIVVEYPQIHQPPPYYRLRQNSTAASVHSTQSSSTEGANTIASQGTKSTVSTVSSVPSSESESSSAEGDKARKKQSWQELHPPTATNTVHSVPMTPVRSSTATNGYTGASLIQQRRVDPLIFGGSDGLWDTIAKSKGSDATVEKIIRYEKKKNIYVYIYSCTTTIATFYGEGDRLIHPSNRDLHMLSNMDMG